MKLKNLLGASLMTLSLMLSVTPQTVLADDETTDVFVTSVETAAATLTEEQYKIYSVAKQQIAEIAAGKRDYAVVEVNIRDTFGQETLDKYNYTLSELGLSESNFDSNGIGDIDADSAFQYKWEEDAGFNYYSNGGSYRINHAVFLSLGYEVYWHDRAGQGYAAWPVRVVLKTLEDGSKVVGMDETSYIPLTFGVSKKYQGSGDKDTFLEQWYRSKGYEVPNFTVNTNVTSATSAQVLRVARKVVADNAGKSDMEKLFAYKDWICKNVDYDESQSAYVGTTTDMGDSSQATNVFDEDASTKVVCEGYAKAFKLLCDLSDFQDETLKCNLVMGPANGSAGGASYGEDHMWNVVTVNGKNYIADVTNSDAGSVGSAGVYFMVGGNRISSWSGFGYSMSGNYIADNGGEGGTVGRVNHSMTYKYDDDTQDAYGTAALTIDANSPIVFNTLEETGRYVAEQMKARNTDIMVSCAGASTSVDLRTAVLNEAFKHTGEAGYGDNLKRQIDSYMPATSNNTVIYDCAYFDTASQVAQFETEAEKVFAGFNLEGKTDYEKIKTIYDWICKNIDYEHDYASALAPRHTASGALLGRAAVCEGYANLTYYFLLKAGIDNRIVVSADHAWNIVKLNGVYYNIDTTWDAGRGSDYRPYKFFLKTDEYYTDTSWYEYNDHHIRLAGDDCSTDEFYAQYPMTRYNYGEEPEMAEAKVTVSFNDEENTSVRPETVRVTLNDGKYDYPVNLTAAENWTASISVPKEGTYTATASAVTGYTAEVTGDLTNGFNADYALNHYTVKWVNYDGTVLETDENVAYGLTPEYSGEAPVREPDDYYSHTFKGWTPAIQAVTADATYRATFDNNYRSSIDYVDSITLSQTTYVYDGTEKKPEVIVKDSGEVLKEGVDYTVAYANNINAGTASVILTGINGYRSTSTKTFTIEKAEQKLAVSPAEVTLKVGDTAELTVEADDEVTYTSADTAVATVENGTITAVGAGETTITVTVLEKENYKAATADVKVTVEADPVDISTLTVKLTEENFVYDGTEKKPAVTVENNDTALTEGTDYTVAYENNINAGTATVTVTGIGNYFGTITKTFEIAKAEQKLTVTPTEVALKVGETAVLTVEADDEVTYTTADAAVATVENGTITAISAGETTVTVTVAEKDNYKAAAAEVKVTVEEVPPTELEILAEDIANTETPEEVVTFEGNEEEVQEVKEKIEAVKTSGETLTVELEGNTMTEVPETETTLVVETVKPDEQTQIEYFDVNLLLKAGEEQIAKIVETKEPITVTLPLSEEAKGADQYKVIRVHEGVAKELQCTVSEDGNYISFKTDKFSTYAIVSITEIKATSISVSPAILTVKQNETAQLTAAVEPAEADQAVTWKTSNEKIATVDENGLVTGHTAGRAVITAETSNGLTASSEVIVDDGYFIYSHSLNLEGKVGVNFFIYSPADMDTKTKAVVTFNNTTTEKLLSGYPRHYADDEETVKLRVITVDVAAAQLRDTISIKLVNTETDETVALYSDGEAAQNNVHEYRALDYMNYMRSATDKESLKNLVNALDNYGKYAQYVFSYNTDNLDSEPDGNAIKDITAETLKPYEMVPEGSVTGLRHKKNSLALNSDTSFRVYFETEEGHAVSEYMFYIDGTRAAVRGNASTGYAIMVGNIPSALLDTEHEFEAVPKEGTGSIRMTGSALSYLYDVVSNENSTEAQKNVAKALYNYNQAANAYFGK